MKTIQSVDTVTIKVMGNELIADKWLNYQLLSKKIGEVEKEKNLGYKSLRNKLYNSTACGKYNTAEMAGLKCIDIDNPMKSSASLVLKFERA
jgi:hypothetical protein